MKKKRKNIYKIARNCTNLTQEQAAELLHISPRSLSDYEQGKTIPGDDVVCKMIEIYGTKWLAYEYLRQSTKVGQRYLPKIDFSDLARSVLRLQKEVRDLEYVNNDMIDIACDGMVEEHETIKWQKVVKEINEMAGAALAVVFSGGGQDASRNSIRFTL